MCVSVSAVRGLAEEEEVKEDEEEEGQEEQQEVFTVELRRGPHGLGLALVDGMVRPLTSDLCS